MAKHFKESPAETTRPMRARTALKRVPAEETRQVRLPYGDAASYQVDYGRPMPTENFFDETMVPARGGIRSVGRGLLLLLAWAARIAAIFLFLILMMHVLGLPVFRTPITTVTDTITGVMPWRNLTVPALDTPFGGSFRIDLAFMCVALFVIDWLLCKLRAALR